MNPHIRRGNVANQHRSGKTELQGRKNASASTPSKQSSLRRYTRLNFICGKHMPNKPWQPLSILKLVSSIPILQHHDPLQSRVWRELTMSQLDVLGSGMPPRRRKRYHRRGPWACDECRLRKRKCDGSQPCSPCVSTSHCKLYLQAISLLPLRP